MVTLYNTLDELVVADSKQIIALMLWKERHANPEMVVKITEADIRGLADCTTYQGIEADVRIYRRPAIPPHDAIPGQPGRAGVNAFPGMPAADFVTVAMVAKGTEDTFRPIENNEQDFAIGEKLRNRQRLIANAVPLANRVKNSAANGDFASTDIMELADIVLSLT
jgi:hypothetical protein